MKADIADPFTIADLQVRGAELPPAERVARATATVRRHAIDDADAAELLAMLGLTVPTAATTGELASPERVCRRCSRLMCPSSTPKPAQRGRVRACGPDICQVCHMTERRALAEGRPVPPYRPRVKNPPHPVDNWLCKTCSRQMYGRRWPMDSRTGRVGHSAHGQCSACYISEKRQKNRDS